MSARRRANGFAQSLFLWVLRRVLGDLVAYGGGGDGGCGCTTTSTHVKKWESGARVWNGAEECLLSRRRSAVIVPSKARMSRILHANPLLSFSHFQKLFCGSIC